MTSYSSAFIVIATVWLSCTSSAKAEEFGDPVKGMELAISMCAECHAVGEDTKDTPEPNAPSFRAVAAMPSTTRMAISAWFRSPHPSMPSLIIEDENANDLIAYILSLKGK
jgi:mono/diheme cytochrome c family protein